MNALLDAITLTGHRLANARQTLRAKHKARLVISIVNCTQLLQLIQLLQLQTNEISQSRAYTDLLNLLMVQELAVKRT